MGHCNGILDSQRIGSLRIRTPGGSEPEDLMRHLIRFVRTNDMYVMTIRRSITENFNAETLTRLIGCICQISLTVSKIPRIRSPFYSFY